MLNNTQPSANSLTVTLERKSLDADGAKFGAISTNNELILSFGHSTFNDKTGPASRHLARLDWTIKTGLNLVPLRYSAYVVLVLPEEGDPAKVLGLWADLKSILDGTASGIAQVNRILNGES